jgi:hypothetical protein
MISMFSTAFSIPSFIVMKFQNLQILVLDQAQTACQKSIADYFPFLALVVEQCFLH